MSGLFGGQSDVGMKSGVSRLSRSTIFFDVIIDIVICKEYLKFNKFLNSQSIALLKPCKWARFH